MHPPSFSEFQQLAMHGNVIPMAESLLADLVTPVAAYLKLCGPDGDGFLLESVEGGEAVGRYSFLGHAPRQLIGFDGRHVTITRDGAAETVGDHLFTYLQEHQRRYRFVPNPDLPRFSGGLVGFFGYDTVRQLENLPERHAPGDRPEASFGLYDTILAFDHLRHQILVITNVILEEGEDLKAAYQAGLDRIAATRESLSRPLDLTPFAGNGHADVSSSFSEKAFTAAVNTAKRHIRAGDIFQVVLSQQFSRKVSAPPIDIYRALRLVNPSPYLYYLKNGDHHVIGSSPEMLVRVDGGEITVRPIAGTRPRGRGPEEDQRLGEELLADEKERAEHVMLVDLGRNDVGRAADYGSVRLTENMIVERYSHVMHIVSEVKGRLRPGTRRLLSRSRSRRG